MKLRPHQVKAAAEREEAHRNGVRAVMVQSPTGSGKTVTFAESAGTEIGRVLVMAHRVELINQACDKLYAAGVPCTRFPSATPSRVQVGSVQTLARRQLPPYARIIVDEAHHSTAKGYRAILDGQPGAVIDGYSATPSRLGGQGLDDVYGHLVVGPQIAELIDLGLLVRPRTFGPERGPDLTTVRTVAGEYNAADLVRVMNKPKLIGNAAAHYEDLCPGVPAVAFCVSVPHAFETAAAFRAEGWRATAVWGGMADDDRKAAFAGLAAGRYHVLTSCSLIDEGLDIPDIRCVIDLAPTKALGRFLQRVGRGLRTATGKTELWHIDHAGNTFRHNMPAVDRVWTLKGQRTSAKPPPVVQCPNCYAMHSPAPRCPECGHDYGAAREAAERKALEVEAGRLSEMTPEDIRLEHLRKAPLKELIRGMNMLQLEEVQKVRGYSPGWADHVMRFKRQAAARQ